MTEEISCDTRYDPQIDKHIKLCARLNSQEIIRRKSESVLGTEDHRSQSAGFSAEAQISRDRDTIATSDILDDSMLLIVWFAMVESARPLNRSCTEGPYRAATMGFIYGASLSRVRDHPDES